MHGGDSVLSLTFHTVTPVHTPEPVSFDSNLLLFLCRADSHTRTDWTTCRNLILHTAQGGCTSRCKQLQLLQTQSYGLSLLFSSPVCDLLHGFQLHLCCRAKLSRQLHLAAILEVDVERALAGALPAQLFPHRVVHLDLLHVGVHHAPAAEPGAARRGIDVGRAAAAGRGALAAVEFLEAAAEAAAAAAGQRPQRIPPLVSKVGQACTAWT